MRITKAIIEKATTRILEKLENEIDGLNVGWRNADSKHLPVSIALKLTGEEYEVDISYVRDKVKIQSFGKITDGEAPLFEESAAGKFQNITNPLPESMRRSVTVVLPHEWEDFYHWLIGVPEWIYNNDQMTCSHNLGRADKIRHQREFITEAPAGGPVVPELPRMTYRLSIDEGGVLRWWEGLAYNLADAFELAGATDATLKSAKVLTTNGSGGWAIPEELKEKKRAARGSAKKAKGVCQHKGCDKPAPWYHCKICDAKVCAEHQEPSGYGNHGGLEGDLLIIPNTSWVLAPPVPRLSVFSSPIEPCPNVDGPGTGAPYEEGTRDDLFVDSGDLPL